MGEKNITVEHNSSAFSDLSKALSVAQNIAKKKRSIISVTLPPTNLSLKGRIKIGNNVRLLGKAGTVITLSSGSQLSANGSNIYFTNIEFNVNGDKECIEVLPNRSITAENCKFVFSADSELNCSPVVIQGSANFLGCEIENFCLSVGLRAQLKATDTKWNLNRDIIVPTRFALLMNPGSKGDLKNCEINNFVGAVCVKDSASLKALDCKFRCVKDGVSVENAQTTLEKCTIGAPKGKAVYASGKNASITLVGSKLENFNTGIRLDFLSKADLSNCEIIGNDSSENGIHAEDKVNITIQNSKIIGVGGVGLYLHESIAELKGVEIDSNAEGGIFATEGSNIKGEKVSLSNNGDFTVTLEFESVCALEELICNKANKGIFLRAAAFLRVNRLDVMDFAEVGIECVDSGLMVNKGKIFHKGKKANGLRVKFQSHGNFLVRMRNVIFRGCNTGAVIQESAPERAGDLQTSIRNVGSTRALKFHAVDKKISSVCKIENCSFVQCKVGCHVDRAACDLMGSSFVHNSQHSIVILNQVLVNVGQLKKEAKLKIRWANFIESVISESKDLSNDPDMLAAVTIEQEYRVMQEFEKVLYRGRITERIRQAMGLYGSKDNDSMSSARIIMKSIFHVLKLVKGLTKELLDLELIESPKLGMFAATFQLESEKIGKDNTLIKVEELMESWEGLKRTRFFDEALDQLREAFLRKQVDEDMYDETVDPLEEMQRKVYETSKYNRRREYLLTLAKENPLSAWYFLVKESTTSAEGKKLRKEILMFFAEDKPEYRETNKSNFHGSWVAQWAASMLGKDLAELSIPASYNLRRAWADKLLDDGRGVDLISWYNTMGGHYSTEMDQLMQFEALKQVETKLGKLNKSQMKGISNLFGGGGFAAAVKAAGRMFGGKGALPGFLRRIATGAKDAEAVLSALTPVWNDPYRDRLDDKMNVILAVLSQFFLPDKTTQPRIIGTKKAGYETCPACFVQKLHPWNEGSLEYCPDNHLFCRNCLKESMGFGDQELWGKCPGQSDDGENCSAMATRREMEMCGMDQKKIYNILRVRVERQLAELPGWKACNICIGGRAKVTKTYFHCRLCESLVTEDGGADDPTVLLKLLKGFDGSSAARGAGVFRECYHCGVPYEKGNACSTITCANCRKQFSMTWGNTKLNHSFDDKGIGPQRYVPKKAGALWKAGVFKTRKGKLLSMGQQLSEAEAAEVVRRAKKKANELM